MKYQVHVNGMTEGGAVYWAVTTVDVEEKNLYVTDLEAEINYAVGLHAEQKRLVGVLTIWVYLGTTLVFEYKRDAQELIRATNIY